MDEYLDRLTILVDPMVAMVNAADGIDHSTFAAIIERATAVFNKPHLDILLETRGPENSVGFGLPEGS